MFGLYINQYTEATSTLLCSRKLLCWSFSSNFILEVRVLSFSLYQRSQYLADLDVKIMIAAVSVLSFCKSRVLMILLMIILVTEFLLCHAQMFLLEQCGDGMRAEAVCSCSALPYACLIWTLICCSASHLQNSVLTKMKSTVLNIQKDCKIFQCLTLPVTMYSIFRD